MSCLYLCLCDLGGSQLRHLQLWLGLLHVDLWLKLWSLWLGLLQLWLYT